MVLVRFPFSDRSQSKLRPAVVLADAGRGDRILCQITSKPYGDTGAIELTHSAFASGSLRVTSYARPGKLFTASHNLVTSELALAESRHVRACGGRCRRSSARRCASVTTTGQSL